MARHNPNQMILQNAFKVQKSKIRLPWELQFMFSEQHLETQEENELIDDEEKAASIARLKN